MSKAKFNLKQIFQRTSGRCHICGKQLSYSNYGKFKSKGAWEVDHSIPRAAGGSDHGKNLYAACISCNRRKGVKPSKATRSQHGRNCAPYSMKRIVEARKSNTITGVFWGGLLGLRFGPPGLILGAIIGGLFGNTVDVEK